MYKKIIIAIHFALLNISGAWAQSNDSLTGTVSLPNGNATIENRIEIELISYDLLLQVRSRESVEVRIPNNTSTASFNFSNIDRQSLLISGYSLSFFCLRCESEIPILQFYTLEGTRFLRTDPIINSIDLFPSNIDFVLAEGSTISGQVSLPAGELAPRNLDLIVFADDNIPDDLNEDSFTSGGVTRVTIPVGTNVADFSIQGIRPVGNSLQLKYRCENCLGDYRSTGESQGFLSPSVNHTGQIVRLNNSGLPVSGTITIPKTLDQSRTNRIILTYEFEDFDNFLNPLSEFTQTYSVQDIPSKIDFGILVPNNRFEILSLSYRCLNSNDEPCTGVIPQAYYDEASEPFAIDLVRGQRISLDPFEIEFFNTNENLDFCIAPDQDSNGIPDSSNSACLLLFSPAPILQLLLDNSSQ